MGPAGPERIASVFIATFNNNDEYVLQSGQRLPLGRIAIDNTNLCQLTSDDTIKFNRGGLYRIDFVVTASTITNSDNIDPQNNVIAIGFRNVRTNIVYAGGSSWTANEPNVKIVGQGLFIIDDVNLDEMELVNLSKTNLTLNSPYLSDIISNSYFVNPVVTIIIQFLE